MAYLVWLVIFCLLLGLVGVVSQPSPLYGSMGMVVGVGGACCYLVLLGSSFLGLVLFLIYLGGMLVVFVYSAALAADLHPEGWGQFPVYIYVAGYGVVLFSLGDLAVESGFGGGQGWFGLEALGFNVVFEEVAGVTWLYSVGGWILMFCGWSLLLTLFVVLVLVRGRGLGGLRSP